MSTDRLINLHALGEFIAEVREMPKALVPFAWATERVERIGLRYRLACKSETWPQRVVISMLQPRYAKPVEVEISTPAGYETLALDEPQRDDRFGPDLEVARRTAEFGWPMDQFGILIQWCGRERFVPLLGPYGARRAHAWLSDPTDPALPVYSLAVALARLLTGKELPRNPYTGAGFAAQHEGTEAARMLERFARDLSDEQDADRVGRAPE